MMYYTEHNENKVFLPFVIVTTLAAFIILSSIKSSGLESQKIIIISSVIWFIWLTLFILEIKKGNKIAEKNHQLFVKSVITVVISFYFAKTIWTSGYLTLYPINAIFEGKIHIDTLFHSTIAESIKNYGFPSILINDTDFLHYHFGSHLIIALLSSILNVPAFFVYNYFYPIIFIPLYSYLLIYVIIEIRKYKNEKSRLFVHDYILLSFFFIGFFPTDISERIGIWKSSWIISESFLLALIFFLLYILIILKVLRIQRKNTLLIVFLSSLFIFLCSSMKISVGFLLAIGIIYFNFRKNTRKFQFWIVNIFFFIIILLSYNIFSESAESAEIQLLSFVRNYTSLKYISFILHYLYILFFSVVVISYKVSTNMPILPAVKSKYLIIEESVIIISLVSFLPGLILNIGGGSAVYFSYFPELIGICMLLGYNVPGKLQQKLQSKNIIMKYIAIFCMILFILIIFDNTRILSNSKKIYSFIKTMNNQDIAGNNFMENIHNIIELSKNTKKNYCIFLDDNAEVWELYKHNARTSIYIYPALTGIKVINGIYTDGINIYTSNGKYIQKIESSAYGINKSIVTKNVNEKIKKFKYMIYINNDKYQIKEI